MAPRPVLARVLWFVVAAGILVLAFFFLLAAIVAGVLLAGVLLARLWWVSRRIRRAAEAQVVTTEYRVVERERLAQPGLPDETARHERARNSGPSSPP